MTEASVSTFQFIDSDERERIFNQYEVLEMIKNDEVIDPSLDVVGFATDSLIVENDEDVFILYEDVNGKEYRQSFYDFLDNEDFTAEDGSPLVALDIIAKV